MHDFRYRGKEFCCEGLRLRELAERHGTPLYVYSYKTLIGHFEKLRSAFAAISPLICYSVKANSSLAILKALVDRGAGLDIVSGGELYRAKAVGTPPERIVYASVGKTEAEIAEALKCRILFFNVESQPELAAIDRVAARMHRTAHVALRLNPDVEPKTHSYITTGKLTNKFGIDFATAERIIRAAAAFPHVRIRGLHIHIGSQITESAPFVAAIRKIAHFIETLRRHGQMIDYLNIGGGLGITYDEEAPQTAARFAGKVLPLLRGLGVRVIMEPGRFIVGNAGVLVTRVLYVKKTPAKTFIIVDAGMNDLIRPALYGAYHSIVPLMKPMAGARRSRVDVVGPICESGDFFAKARLLAPVEAQEYLAVMSAGAYGFSMSSNYNSRRRAEEVLVAGNRACVIRSREGYEDLVRREIMPVCRKGS